MEKPLLILVADSNPHVRSFLRRELSASGYQVNIAASVKEIFTNLKSEPSPNLLILDINMPVKIGLEVLARLRKLIPRPSVIVYTDLVEYQQYEQVRWVSAFVEKNGSPIPLKQAIEVVLQKNAANLMNQSKPLEIWE